MESMMYFVVFIICLLAILFIGAAGLLLLGTTGIIARRSIEKATKLKLGPVPLIVAIIGCGIFSALSLWVWNAIRIPIEAQARAAGATCLQTLLPQNQRLVVTQFRDGTSEATLQKSDGSQDYIHGITRFALDEQIMIGEIGFQGSTIYWFWYDL